MKNYKTFDECYFSVENRTEYLDDIIDYVKNNRNDLGKYKNYIFCPECKIAELSYVHQTSQRRAFLRRKPNSHHSQNCSYNFEYSSSEFSKQYYEELNSNQIQDKMNSAMRVLFKNEDGLDRKNSIVNNTNNEENPFILKIENNGNQIKKSLRRKNLGKYLDKEEIEGQLHLFYGEVKLSTSTRDFEKENNKYQIYFLNIYCLNKKGEWTKRTSIYRGTINDNIIKDKIYKIVAVGTMDFSKGFPKLELSNKYAILIKEK